MFRLRQTRLPVVKCLTQPHQLLLKALHEFLDLVELRKILSGRIVDRGIFVRSLFDIVSGDPSVRQPAFKENLHGDPYPCCKRSIFFQMMAAAITMAMPRMKAATTIPTAIFRWVTSSSLTEKGVTNS